MADRVRSRNPPSIRHESQLTATQEHAVPRKPTPPASGKPSPPSPDQTYVIQIPRDQVIRVPLSENARRMEQYARRKNRRSPCCCFLCWLITLILIIGIAGGGILYLLHRLKAPRYTVDHISIHGMNLTSTEPQAISPEFDIALRAKNLNNIFGISYQKGSSVKVYYKEQRLGSGALPAFYQPSNNGTVFQTALKGNGIELTRTEAKALLDAQDKRSVQLTLKLKARVKFRAGSVETWKLTVKVNCHITVDNLTVQAKVVSKKCRNCVNLWG